MASTALLSSFQEPLSVAIIGASGGIGRAFVDTLRPLENITTVYACSRTKVADEATHIHHAYLNICDEESIASAAAQAQHGLAPFDLILVATGLLHDVKVSPEKSLKDVSFANFQHVFSVNTFGPALVAKHFLPLLMTQRKSIFAVLSARVGSITDNHLGGWYAYRASKAALNMIIKNLSIEVARKNKQACVIGLHPGTVDTALSQPFQERVKPEKLFTSEQAARYLLGVLNECSAQDTGKIFAWDGQEIPY